MKVYLSGTIAGGDPATLQWREEAQRRLEAADIYIECLSPMRKKSMTKMTPDGLKSAYPTNLLVARDHKDIEECDVMLVYTIGIEHLERQSIGTWWECGIADYLQKPVIFVANHPMVTTHPFVLAKAALVVPTLTEAIDAILWLK